jgi:hypothetical protein
MKPIEAPLDSTGEHGSFNNTAERQFLNNFPINNSLGNTSADPL